MKISFTLDFDTEDGAPSEIIFEKLAEMGFEKKVETKSNLLLTYEGDISDNDLIYAASIFDNMRRR